MLIKSIFMELRSRLRSCNVYITTSVDFRKNCNLKINIQANSIVLNYYPNESEPDECLKPKSRTESLSSIESISDCFSDEDFDVTEIIPIDEFCRIIPNSMSGLRIENNDISFRILTEPKNGGNFYNEVLLANGQTTSCHTSVKDNLTIDVKVSDEVKLHCANCSNTISDDYLKFQRVLELPSENLDISDWFCHNHGGNPSGDAQVFSTKPNKFDLFYRLCFFIVNISVLSDKCNKFNAKRDIYHCDRCLAWLGVRSKDRCSVKFYNSSVKLSRSGAEGGRVFKYKEAPVAGDAVCSDFVYTIEHMTRDFNLGLQYAVMCKLLLECSVTAAKRQFLLIWVMDRELQVLKSVESEGDYILSDDMDRVKLTSGFSTKILYKVETFLSETVECWMSDPGVTSSEISKGMFYSGVDHLQKMSLKVPESFRSSNGFLVTYLNA